MGPFYGFWVPFLDFGLRSEEGEESYLLAPSPQRGVEVCTGPHLEKQNEEEEDRQKAHSSVAPTHR
jgi:hypothetical protein